MDSNLFPPPTVLSGFLPTVSLLESLIQISNEITSMVKLPCVQARNAATMIRRIKLLSSLFEEIQEMNSPLPPSSILCLTELYTIFQQVKFLIQACKEGSILWNLVQTEFTSNKFVVLVKEIARALDILPLSSLKITVDVREQVELLHKQAKRADLFVDPKEVHIREALHQVTSIKNEKTSKNKGSVDLEKMKDILCSIGLSRLIDCEVEISKLEAEAEKQAGTGGLVVISKISNLVSLVSYSKSMIFNNDEDKNVLRNLKHPSSSLSRHADHSSYYQAVVHDIPDEFCCPISLDLMKDPVIVASGHTYDRSTIARWMNSGHHTCPKSGQRLIHMAFIPNYALKNLVHQWCQENNIPLSESTSSSSSDLQSSSTRKLCANPVDHIPAKKAAADAVKRTAEFLVEKLATGSPAIQRQTTYELRLLAKTGRDNRRIIAEAGAIPFLVILLSSSDPRIQENAVTALLNLSIFDNNKLLIMSAGAIDNIVDVLQSGTTVEARENAAAAIFSLSMINDNKVTIGAHPKVIPALVELVKEGTASGKRDACVALFNLAIYNANKAGVVIAGAVPLLIKLLTDDKAGITDDTLALLALLLGCSKGLEEMIKSRVLVPLLIDLLRFGSPKGKENSITLLLGLCKNGAEEVARRLLLNPRSIPSLQSLAADGSSNVRRKAGALLRFLNRCCSQSHGPVG